MKKALAYALSLALVFSLAACSKPQADQPDSNQPDPAATTNQVDATTPETEQPTVTQLSQTEEQAGVQPFDTENVLQGDELIEAFQDTYDGCMGYSFNEDEQIQYEISELTSHKGFYESKSGKSYPADYIQRYIDWRLLDADIVDSADGDDYVEVRFTQVDETVYATGTVNIRADTSVSSTKVGVLKTGESVRRTGIGISGTSAEGWSQCVLSNGQVVFISNRYLSTTQSAGGGSTGGGAPAGGNPTKEIDPSTQHITHDPSSFSDGTSIGEDQVAYRDPVSGWGIAKSIGGAHVG